MVPRTDAVYRGLADAGTPADFRRAWASLKVGLRIESILHVLLLPHLSCVTT